MVGEEIYLGGLVMFLIDADTLKRRLAREWAKMQSMRGPFIYNMADKRVINNKPHIVLKHVPTQPSPYGGYSPVIMPGLGSLFGGLQLPQEEEEWEDEGD
jgi:hypothetical protein